MIDASTKTPFPIGNRYIYHLSSTMLEHLRVPRVFQGGSYERPCPDFFPCQVDTNRDGQYLNLPILSQFLWFYTAHLSQNIWGFQEFQWFPISPFLCQDKDSKFAHLIEVSWIMESSILRCRKPWRSTWICW